LFLGRTRIFLSGLDQRRFRAVAFDGLAIFDPRPVFAAVDRNFPEKGAVISETWRIRQFEYTWLRVAEHRYADFWQVTEEALIYATKKAGVDLSPTVRDELLAQYLRLPVWPDVAEALRALKAGGLRLALLSNFTPKMLESCVSENRLAHLITDLLSTDLRRTYKPDPKAYGLGTEALRLRREEILFVPFAAWDAAGAKSFGYPTFWVNRQNQQAEELGTTVDAVGPSLADLVRFAT
jgi:2-haloacid dehalogenase